jgi:ribonucleoside-triphosphate reductase (thioredoxin)
MDSYQSYIHVSRYARWLEDKERRETWNETVDRWWNYMTGRFPVLSERPDVKDAILNLEVVPSMRTIMTAGEALDRNHVAAYNCSFLAVDDPKAFDEALMVLMCGTGVGFSVERQFIQKLPEIPAEFTETDEIVVVADSKEGWAKAFRQIISRLYAGEIPKWDTSKVRPAGARLKTFGGRASGAEPLENLFRFAVNTFRKAAGRKLNSLECHDIMCQVAAAVVVGGVRRSAMISLSNLSDDRMRHAKMGNWWNEQVNRSYANNSIAFTDKPDMGSFLREWSALYESKSGERGIFNREAAQAKAESIGRESRSDFGTNPCGEISLRSRQFCNLSEVVIRETDGVGELEKKTEIATIIGTIQSALVDFKYLSPKWKKNSEEERLLGVSLTGIFDHKIMSGQGEYEKSVLAGTLEMLRGITRDVNKEWAEKLGINPSKAITTVKPSGTVSQLVNSGSGIHPRYAKHYIRRVRADVKDPLATWMQEKGVPCEVDVYNPQNLVFEFPMASASNSLTRHDIGAIEHLELWLTYRNHWTDHNPSVTIYVGEDEWAEVGAWVYKHWDEVCGVSFLPREDDNHSYAQAPYEEITEQKYKELSAAMPVIDFAEYTEVLDNTTSSQELACTAGVCEI